MKNFFNKQREIIAVLSYVLIIAGIVYLVIFPLLGRITFINDQIQQESMKQESVKLHIEELPKMQKQYEELQSSVDLSNVLLDKNKAVVLIEKLEKMAESSSCKILIKAEDSIQNVAGKKTPVKNDAANAGSLSGSLPSHDYLQLKITLTGKYNSILKFVSMLEKFEYYADITSIQIGKEESGQSSFNEGVFGVSNVPVASTSRQEVASDNDDVVASLEAVFYTN